MLYASIYVTKHDWETFAFPKPSHNTNNAKLHITGRAYLEDAKI